MNKEKITFTINDVPELKKDIEQMQEKYQQQIDQLTNNWNELEEWLKEDLKQIYRDAGYRNNIIREILDKMKEIKGRKDVSNNN